MKAKKLEPIGRIQLAILIMTLEKEVDVIDYYWDCNQISWELSWALWNLDYDLKVFQFQAKDYLYNKKFINFEIMKN